MKNGGEDRYCLFRCILQEQWQLEWICYGKELDSFHTLRITIKKRERERGKGRNTEGSKEIKEIKKRKKKRERGKKIDIMFESSTFSLRDLCSNKPRFYGKFFYGKFEFHFSSPVGPLSGFFTVLARYPRIMTVKFHQNPLSHLAIKLRHTSSHSNNDMERV